MFQGSLIMQKLALLCAGLILAAGAAQADMSVQLGGNWNGKTVPSGQQCMLFGGKGATPPMKASGLPAGTAWVVVEFNDRDYRPLSRNGGHGVIAYPANGATADLYSVPGMTNRLPGKARVMSAARSTGDYASSGYLPPCSGGKKNRYFAVIKAMSAAGKVLDQTQVELGRY
jgi:hypothetical protein